MRQMTKTRRLDGDNIRPVGLPCYDRLVWDGLVGEASEMAEYFPLPKDLIAPNAQVSPAIVLLSFDIELESQVAFLIKPRSRTMGGSATVIQHDHSLGTGGKLFVGINFHSGRQIGCKSATQNSIPISGDRIKEACEVPGACTPPTESKTEVDYAVVV